MDIRKCLGTAKCKKTEDRHVECDAELPEQPADGPTTEVEEPRSKCNTRAFLALPADRQDRELPGPSRNGTRVTSQQALAPPLSQPLAPDDLLDLTKSEPLEAELILTK